MGYRRGSDGTLPDTHYLIGPAQADDYVTLYLETHLIDDRPPGIDLARCKDLRNVRDLYHEEAWTDHEEPLHPLLRRYRQLGEGRKKRAVRRRLTSLGIPIPDGSMPSITNRGEGAVVSTIEEDKTKLEQTARQMECHWTFLNHRVDTACGDRNRKLRELRRLRKNGRTDSERYESLCVQVSRLNQRIRDFWSLLDEMGHRLRDIIRTLLLFNRPATA